MNKNKKLRMSLPENNVFSDIKFPNQYIDQFLINTSSLFQRWLSSSSSGFNSSLNSIQAIAIKMYYIHIAELLEYITELDNEFKYNNKRELESSAKMVVSNNFIRTFKVSGGFFYDWAKKNSISTESINNFIEYDEIIEIINKFHKVNVNNKKNNSNSNLRTILNGSNKTNNFNGLNKTNNFNGLNKTKHSNIPNKQVTEKENNLITNELYDLFLEICGKFKDINVNIKPISEWFKLKIKTSNDLSIVNAFVDLIDIIFSNLLNTLLISVKSRFLKGHSLNVDRVQIKVYELDLISNAIISYISNSIIGSEQLYDNLKSELYLRSGYFNNSNNSAGSKIGTERELKTLSGENLNNIKSHCSAIHLFGGLPFKIIENINSSLRTKIKNKGSRTISSSLIPKNKSGSFYTPSWLANYIITNSLNVWLKYNAIDEENIAINANDESNKVNKKIYSINNIKLLDPAVGFCSFLDQLMLGAISYNEPAKFINLNDVYGFDIDSKAIDINRLNHAIISRLGFSSIPHQNFQIHDSMLHIENLNMFDIIVGNPPWGAEIKRKELLKNKQIKRFIIKQIDSYAVFLIKFLYSLENGGVLSFLIPETLLLNPNYNVIREFLIKNYTIIEILHLGEEIFDNVIQPCMIITVLNQVPKKEHTLRIISILRPDLLKKMFSNSINNHINLLNLIEQCNVNPLSTPSISDNQPSADNQSGNQILSIHRVQDIIKINKRLQSEFASNSDFIFDIFNDQQTREISRKIEELCDNNLGDILSNSRGIEIGKKGKAIQCYHCKRWFPLPRWKLGKDNQGKYTTCPNCRQIILQSHPTNKQDIITRIADVRNTGNVKIDLFVKQKKPETILEFKIQRNKILDKFSSDNSKYQPIILGEDINKFSFKITHIIKKEISGIRYKKEELYNKEKIIFKKTSKNLQATIDYDKFYTIQVVYQFSLKEKFKNNPLLLEFILGYLLSDTIEKYYNGKFKYFGRTSFPHHIQKNILSIPIPKINPEEPIFIEIAYITLLLMFLNSYMKNGFLSEIVLKKLSYIIENYPNLPILSKLIIEFNRTNSSATLIEFKIDIPNSKLNISNDNKQNLKITQKIIDELEFELDIRIKKILKIEDFINSK